jgi:pyrroloquinoline quinone (PQQ) biosynthesis protein C
MVAVGVDTHKERHYAVALDQLGQLLGERSFGACAAGYTALQHWAEALGESNRSCSASRAPAAGEQASASTYRTVATPWWRSSIHVEANAGPASLIASTR